MGKPIRSVVSLLPTSLKKTLLLETPTSYSTWFTIALANHWLGRSKEALAAASEIALDVANAEEAFGIAAIRAIAHHRLGDERAAREWLAHALRRFQTAAGVEEADWKQSSYYALLTEARTLID